MLLLRHMLVAGILGCLSTLWPIPIPACLETLIKTETKARGQNVCKEVLVCLWPNVHSS